MSFFLPSLYWSSSSLQLLLAPLATNSQGQKKVLVSGSKDEALPLSTPFHSTPGFGTWSFPGCPRPSLVVLFYTACHSSGPLLCRMTLSEMFSQAAFITMVQSSSFSLPCG